MANKYKGEVAFRAGSEDHVLRLSANAIVAIEEKFDKTINQMGQVMSDPEQLKMSTVKTIFTIGLLDHNPDLSEADASGIFGKLSPIEATDVVVKAFTAAFGIDSGGQAAPAANPPQALKPVKAGTG